MNFESNVKKRAQQILQLQQNISKMKEEITKSNSKAFFDQKCKQLERMWECIVKTTEKMMEDTKYDSTDGDEFNDIRDEYDDIIIAIREKQVTSSRQIELPEIKIPIFNGDMTQWTSFHDLFNNVFMKNKDLSEVERFYFLKTQLVDEALQLIQHLQPTEDNFKIAWQLLTQRYNNQRRMVDSYVKRILTQPQIKHGTADKLKELHDTTKECILALKNMEINTDRANFLLNVIIEGKMDEESIRMYESTINQPREQQNFDELMKFIERRFQTLESLETSNGPNKSGH